MATFSSQLDAAVPDVAHAAWARVQEQWDDTDTHDELLRLIILHGCYAWAAARYRDRRGEAGPPFREIGDARDPIAERQLDRIRRAAEVALLTTGTRRRDDGPTSYRSARMLLGVVIVLIIVGLAYAMYQSMRPSDSQPKPPASQVR